MTLFALEMAKEEMRRLNTEQLRLRDRLLRNLYRHKERYVRAWIAATGADPRHAVLQYWYDAGKQCVQVVYKADSDLRSKLWELLDAGQCTAETVRDALRLAE